MKTEIIVKDGPYRLRVKSPDRPYDKEAARVAERVAEAIGAYIENTQRGYLLLPPGWVTEWLPTVDPDEESTRVTCPACDGEPCADSIPGVECSACEGAGWVWVEEVVLAGWVEEAPK